MKCLDILLTYVNSYKCYLIIPLKCPFLWVSLFYYSLHSLIMYINSNQSSLHPHHTMFFFFFVLFQEKAITPSESFLFPDTDWLIGNHSDELTPWIPVIAARPVIRTHNLTQKLKCHLLFSHWNYIMGFESMCERMPPSHTPFPNAYVCWISYVMHEMTTWWQRWTKLLNQISFTFFVKL